MEGNNHLYEQPSELAEQPSHDEQAIRLGIEAARGDGRPVDDTVARVIAVLVHGGQGSALYSLASTGNLTDDRLQDELRRLHDEADEKTLEWVEALEAYAATREERGPVDGWSQLWPAALEPTTDAADEGGVEESDSEPAAGPISGGSQALGQVVAHIVVDYRGDALEGTEREPHNELDDMPWGDAARWRPDDDVHDSNLDLLFAAVGDEQVGSTDDMGWAGLVRFDNRPGGAVLHVNHYGHRWTWTTDSNDELVEHWDQVRRQHDAFQSATRSAGNEVDALKIWVGSLSDYNAGYLHGEWLDATVGSDELEDAIQFLLYNSHEPDAEEYAVMDYDGFGHGLTTLLGEYPNLQTISRLAEGIAQHGEAFAVWAAYVGPEQHEQLDQFEDHYLGEWESMRSYAEHLLDEMEAFRFLDDAPEWLQPYIELDIDSYARDLEMELHIEESGTGRTWIFDTRV